MSKAAERQQAFRDRRAAEGIKQCTVWIPETAIPDFQLLAEAIRRNPTWELGMTLKNERHQFVSVKNAIRTEKEAGIA